MHVLLVVPVGVWLRNIIECQKDYNSFATVILKGVEREMR